MGNNFYNGNPNIKKAGVKQNYTKGQMEEYVKCSQDPLYFIKKYVKIISLDEGLVLFDMWDFQEKMITSFHANRFSINLLPRQMGKTITVAAYLMHYAIFNPTKSVGILANKEGTAKEILARMKRMLENLPFFLQPGVVEYNKKSVEFGNGSVVMAGSTSSDSIRGFSFNCIYLDEFAFVDQADAFYTSTYPVISSGSDTKVIMTSTPNGMNLFYKIWTEAKLGRNRYVPIEVHWSDHPKRDEKWKEETLSNIGNKQFQQEYGCRFHGSSDTLIDGEVLVRLTWIPPEEETDQLVVYEQPKEGHTYVATVDVSEGAGSDFSVCMITDITEKPYQQVAMYRSNSTTPLVFPEIIESMARNYNEAFVLVETNSIGSQVATILYYEYEYENMITTIIKNSDNQISSGFGGRVEMGVRTTKKSKHVGCSNIKTLIENDIYEIRDYNTIEELNTFSKKGTSYEAEEGKTDDIAMTLVIFGWLSTQDYFDDLVDANIRSDVLNRQKNMIEEALTPMGYHNDITEYMEQHEGTNYGWDSNDTGGSDFGFL